MQRRVQETIKRKSMDTHAHSIIEQGRKRKENKKGTGPSKEEADEGVGEKERIVGGESYKNEEKSHRS